MSSFQALAMIMAIIVANMPIYFVVERSMQERAHAVISGVFRGVPISLQHRWFMFQHSWVPSVAGLIGFESIVAMGFIVIGRHAETEEVKLFAYLNGFVLLVGPVLGGLGQGMLSYSRLRSVLRQAEAD